MDMNMILTFASTIMKDVKIKLFWLYLVKYGIKYVFNPGESTLRIWLSFTHASCIFEREGNLKVS
jgi:hypothetical protein